MMPQFSKVKIYLLILDLLTRNFSNVGQYNRDGCDW